MNTRVFASLLGDFGEMWCFSWVLTNETVGLLGKIKKNFREPQYQRETSDSYSSKLEKTTTLDQILNQI